jgi:hypothetical protein
MPKLQPDQRDALAQRPGRRPPVSICLALAAFNAVPGRVDRARAVPQIAETQAYVVNVIDCFLALTAGRSVRSVRDCRAGPAALDPPPAEAAHAACQFGTQTGDAPP